MKATELRTQIDIGLVIAAGVFVFSCGANPAGANESTSSGSTAQDLSLNDAGSESSGVGSLDSVPAAAAIGLCADPKGLPNQCALAGGQDQNGDILYYCVAFHSDGSTQPGKWLHADGQCHYSYGGKELRTTSFYWVDNTNCTSGWQLRFLLYSQLVALQQVCSATDPRTGGTRWYTTQGSDSDFTPMAPCSTLVYASGSVTPLSKHHQPGKEKNGACYVAYGGKEYVMNAKLAALGIGGSLDFPVPVYFPANDPCSVKTFTNQQRECN